MVDKTEKSKLPGSALVILWLARLLGYVWILVGLVGLGLSGGLDPFAFAFLVSVTIASFAPRWWFEDRDYRKVMAVVVLAGLLGPLGLFIEQWPKMASLDIPTLQCVPIVLFLCVLVISRVLQGRRGASSA